MRPASLLLRPTQVCVSARALRPRGALHVTDETRAICSLFADVWLAWIRFELGLNHLERAATLHQRAVRAVPDPLAFMAAYNALV